MDIYIKPLQSSCCIWTFTVKKIKEFRRDQVRNYLTFPSTILYSGLHPIGGSIFRTVGGIFSLGFFKQCKELEAKDIGSCPGFSILHILKMIRPSRNPGSNPEFGMSHISSFKIKHLQFYYTMG